MDIYDFSVKDIQDNEVALSDYKGKVLLIVNTATQCGLTPQYSGLQELYEKFQDRGFEILDFPCNQFANQAPQSNEEIGSMCTGRFGISFKQFAKIEVNGPNEDPLYTWLKQAKGGLGSAIKWNFTKFLVNKEGKVVARFAPTKAPASLEKEIRKLIEEE